MLEGLRQYFSLPVEIIDIDLVHLKSTIAEG